jgi:hypothetical protein
MARTIAYFDGCTFATSHGVLQRTHSIVHLASFISHDNGPGNYEDIRQVAVASLSNTQRNMSPASPNAKSGGVGCTSVLKADLALSQH